MKNKMKGSQGFGQDYWDENYSEPLEMDNIGNAREHMRYLKAVFQLEQVDINSVIDLGFGLGHLFEEAIKEFTPYRATGIEPSEFAFKSTQDRLKRPDEVHKFKMSNIDLVSWSKNIKDSDKVYDLGICTSVFQYLNDEEIQLVLPIMARQIKFLYFSVPTDLEYKRQLSEYEFFDQFAIHRKREKYLKWIRPYFTFVGTRILESKHHFDDDSTHFKEQLFRF